MAYMIPPMETGWPTLDEQHRALFGRLSSVLSALDREEREAAHGAAASLVSEVQAHFEHEAALMSGCAYPDRLTHEEAHAAFLGELQGLVGQLTGAVPLRIAKLWASSRFAPWFLHHVRSHDCGLARFLRRAEEDRAKELEQGLAPGSGAETAPAAAGGAPALAAAAR